MGLYSSGDFFHGMYELGVSVFFVHGSPRTLLTTSQGEVFQFFPVFVYEYMVHRILLITNSAINGTKGSETRYEFVLHFITCNI